MSRMVSLWIGVLGIGLLAWGALSPHATARLLRSTGIPERALHQQIIAGLPGMRHALTPTARGMADAPHRLLRAGALCEQLPARFDGLTTVRQGDFTVSVRAAGAREVESVDEQGVMVYHEAYAHTDALYLAKSDQAEEFLYLHDAQAPRQFAFELRFPVSATLHREQGRLLLSDATHTLMVRAPTVIDALGRTSVDAARWSFSSRQAGTAALQLTLRDQGLSYPLLIDPSWVAVTTMTHARWGQTATLMADGTVLAVGGYDGTTILSSCESYQPSTPLWTALGVGGTLHQARFDHRAVLLDNGKLLVAGGITGFDLPWLDFTTASAEIYAAGSWTTTGPLATSRSDMVAVNLGAIGGHQVLFAGGLNSASETLTCELFDQVSNTFSATGSLGQYHSSAGSALIGSTVLVAGGQQTWSSGAPTAACELYQITGPQAGTWIPTGSMRYPRSRFPLVPLANGSYLAIGGMDGSNALDTCEIYDPLSGTWAPTGSLLHARENAVATVLADQTVLVCGGDLPQSNGGAAMAFCESYTVSTGTWSALPNLPQGLSAPAAIPLPNSRLLIAGGTTGDGSLISAASCEFDPTAANTAPTITSPATVTCLSDQPVTIALPGSDPESNALTYRIVSAPLHGSVSSFTGNQLIYQSDVGYHGADSFTVIANDGALDSNLATQPITVHAIPQITLGPPPSVAVGGSVVITSSNWVVSDPDDSASQLSLTLVQAPAYGQIADNGAPVISGGTFSLTDLASGLVTYTQTGGTPSRADTLGLNANDGIGTSTTIVATFLIQLGSTGTTVPPTIVHSACSVNPSGVHVISASSELQVTPGTAPPTQLTFTVTQFPSNGTVMLNHLPLSAANPTFTDADVIAGLLSYQYNGLHGEFFSFPPIDSIGYTLSDGVNSRSSSLAISVVSATPYLKTNSGESLHTFTFVQENTLASVDSSVTPQNLIYTIITAPTQGTLYADGVPLLANSTFNEQDLALNLFYLYLGSVFTTATTDSFQFTVSGNGVTIPASGTYTYTFTILPQVTVHQGQQLVVQSHGQVGVGGSAVSITDAFFTPGQITCILEVLPTCGTLRNAGVPMAQGDSFVLQDVNEGLITYDQDGADAEGDRFSISYYDEINTDGTENTIGIAINHPPQVITDQNMHASQGLRTVLSDSILLAQDREQLPAQLIYTVTVAATHGQLQRSLVVVPIGGTFTQDDIDRGLISYLHDGSGSTQDSITVNLSDGAGGSVSGVVVPITISTTLQSSGQGSLLVAAGSSAVVTPANLSVSETGVSVASLAYTITTAPSVGTLFRQGVALGVGGSCSQADIDSGLVSYVQDGADANADGVEFMVGDGSGAVQVALLRVLIHHPPVAVLNTTLLLPSSDSVARDLEYHLAYADEGVADSDILYTIVQPPGTGTLTLNGQEVLAAGATFTQQDLEDHLLQYTGQAILRSSDEFSFVVSNPDGDATAPQTFSISYLPAGGATLLIESVPPLIAIEGTITTINQDELSAIWQSESNDTVSLVWQITTLPGHGTIDANGVAMTLGGSFTSADLASGVITYTPAALASGPDSIVFEVSDNGFTTEIPATLSIVIEPPLTLSQGMLLGQAGRSVTLGDPVLTVSGASMASTALSYELTAVPSHGSLILDGRALIVGSTWTQDEVSNGLLSYAQDGTDGESDAFSFTYGGGAFPAQPGTESISINHAPVLVAQSALTLTAHDSITLGDPILLASDREQSAPALTYTITTAPTQGVLSIAGQTLNATSPHNTFTQSDVDAGTISYTAGAASDVLGFTLSDGAGGMVGPFTITVTVAGAASGTTSGSTADFGSTAASGSTVSGATGGSSAGATGGGGGGGCGLGAGGMGLLAVLGIMRRSLRQTRRRT